MDLSVIIVSFNTKEKLRQCLRSVFASQTNFKFEVFVVDNASQDGSADMVAGEFPNVKLVRNKQNLGYSKANNIAMRQTVYPSPQSSPARGEEAGPRYFLLLNSDVEVQADTFDKMILFMDNDKDIGIAGCRVVKADGSFDEACRRNFPDIKNALQYFLGFASSYHPNLPYDETAEVDSVMGAFLMIREETVSKIGLLDEAFFMYGEDLDWCMRAKKAGYKVMYAPVTTVVHHKGSSSRRLPKKALYEFHRAMFIFYDKHYARQHTGFVNFLVKLGIWTRYGIKLAQNGFRTEKFVSK